jgi:hypothetical protein
MNLYLHARSASTKPIFRDRLRAVFLHMQRPEFYRNGQSVLVFSAAYGPVHNLEPPAEVVLARHLLSPESLASRMVGATVNHSEQCSGILILGQLR